MRTLLEDLAKIDKALEIELLELTRDLMPIQVAQVLAEELGLKGLNQNILHSRILGLYGAGKSSVGRERKNERVK